MRKGLIIALSALLMLSLFAACGLAQGLQNVELHGYAQNRLYANPDASARFQLFRLSLSGVAQVGKDGTVYTEVYFHPWASATPPAGVTSNAVYVESAYVDLPFAGGRVRFGKGRQLNFGMTPTYPNRKLSEYSILQETFTQDRITGAQYAYKSGVIDAGATVYTDLRGGAKAIGGVPGAEARQSVRHIIDQDDQGNPSGRLAVTGRFGIATPCLQAHISGGTGRLTQTDVDTINGLWGIAPGGERTHGKYGVDAAYTYGKYVAEGEYYVGRYSALQLKGWSALIGYQPKGETRFYARYSAIDNNLGEIAAQQLTWEPRQLTIGIIQPIRPGIWAELEYEKNTERTGGAANVDNDLLFLEMFSGF